MNPKQFSTAQRLFRRLRPVSKLLTFQITQIEGSTLVKIFTEHRVIAIWPSTAMEPWFGDLGGETIYDPSWTKANRRSCHASRLENAAWWRTTLNYKACRESIEEARRSRRLHGLGWTGA